MAVSWGKKRGLDEISGLIEGCSPKLGTWWWLIKPKTSNTVIVSGFYRWLWLSSRWNPMTVKLCLVSVEKFRFPDSSSVDGRLCVFGGVSNGWRRWSFPSGVIGADQFFRRRLVREEGGKFRWDTCSRCFDTCSFGKIPTRVVGFYLVGFSVW